MTLVCACFAVDAVHVGVAGQFLAADMDGVAGGPWGKKKNDEYQGGVWGHELAIGGGEGDQSLKLLSGTVKS